MEEENKSVKDYKVQLPPIGELFSVTNALFKEVVLKLLGFNLIIFGLSFFVAIIFIVLLLIFVGGGILSLSHGNFSNLSAGLILIGVIISIIFVVGLVIISVVSQAGQIIIIDQPKASFDVIFKKGLHFALPLFLLSIVSLFLMIPPLFLLFIPGLFVVFFLYFSTYAVVVGNYGVLNSLRRSIYLIKSNFLEMFIRALIVVGMYALLFTVFSMLSLLTLKGGILSLFLGLIFSLARLIVSTLLGWYVLVYSVTLYKQAESITPDKKKGGRLLWFVLLSIVSLVFVALIAGTVIKVASSNPEIKNAFLQGAKNSAANSSSNYSPSSADSAYKNIFKSTFVKSCEQSAGSSAKDCSCIADYMVKNYTLAELENMNSTFAKTKTPPKELVKAASACVTK